MAHKHDIDRLKLSKESWNSWAEEQLRKQKELRKNAEWSVDKNGHGVNQATREWIVEASVDFSGKKFLTTADFSGFVFPYTANFATAEFKHRADFTTAMFFGNAIFRDAIFNSVARFNSARFYKDVGFRRTTFLGNSWFIASRFEEKAVF